MIESSTVDLYDRSIDPYDTSGIRMSQFLCPCPNFRWTSQFEIGALRTSQFVWGVQISGEGEADQGPQ